MNKISELNARREALKIRLHKSKQKHDLLKAKIYRGREDKKEINKKEINKKEINKKEIDKKLIDKVDKTSDIIIDIVKNSVSIWKRKINPSSRKQTDMWKYAKFINDEVKSTIINPWTNWSALEIKKIEPCPAVLHHLKTINT